MISEELKKYIQMVAEEEREHEETDNILYEMANIYPRYHGIDDIVIWIGEANKQHGLRVKVSNAKNRYDKQNSFVIQMPSLDYDPAQVAKWIDSKKMNQILSWIKLNQKLLYDFENGIIGDTGLFLDSISKA